MKADSMNIRVVGGCSRHRLYLGLFIALAALAADLPVQAQQVRAASVAPQKYSIAAGTLGDALNQWAAQSQMRIVYAPELVQGKIAPAVSGTLTWREALQKLLAGSGLEWNLVGNNLVAVRKAAAPQQPADVNQKRASKPKASAPKVQQLGQVTVTGTRIRGAQPSSPLVVITQEDMRLAGDNNLGDVIRSLPQNFSGGQNPGVGLTAIGGLANQNITGGSALDLRGLGPDATLTLLDGARLPYDGFSQATDVAMIPMAAIDRVEILLDGASAIYGSDAIAGVANIVLKRDYNGAEITARTGAATDGGYDQTQVSLVTGNTWASGGLLVAAETDSSGAVRASQRDYLSYMSNPDLMTIYPKLSQNGVLLSGHQELGPSVELAVDAFYTKRSMSQDILLTPIFETFGADTSIYGISPSLRFTLPHDWSMRVYGFMGEDKANTPARVFSIATGTQIVYAGAFYRNRAEAAGVEFEGPLFSLPGGDARLSIGGGWRKAAYETGNLLTGIISTVGANLNRSLYGEINLPLMKHLSLDGAVRYDDYNRFGGTTTPKIGVLWNVSPSLDIRASWGKSFKAPTVLQQYQARSVNLYTAASAGILNVPTNTTVLITSGGNPDLQPERADVKTAGLVIHPSLLPGLTIEPGWFDINYKQRVVYPIPVKLAQYAQILTDPNYASFLIKSPTAAQQQAAIQSLTFYNETGQPYDPNSVVAIFNNNYFNASSEKVRGVDLDMRYEIPTPDGSLVFNAGGSWLTHAGRRNINGVPPFAVAGVVGYPPKFKGRVGATWSHSNLSLSAIVNHLDGVQDTSFVPSRQGNSMTTLDLVFDYAANVGQLQGLGFNVSVINAFNQRPPYMAPLQPYYVNYDSTNYSALGRVVNLSITKRF